MSSIKSPCFGCKNRTIGCHSNCEKYIKFSKILDDIRKKKKLQSISDGYDMSNGRR